MYVPLTLLRRHVLESNRIEGYTTRSLPLYRSHLEAALKVARNPLWEMPLHPRVIHEVLCRGTHMNCYGGYYRSCRMWIGGHEAPGPLAVPELMSHWWGMVEQSYEYHEREFRSNSREKAWTARFLHNWFLCIHPFEDGNGRTARLFLNSLRLSYGLSWHTVEYKYRHGYYRSIRSTERTFKKEIEENKTRDVSP